MSNYNLSSEPSQESAERWKPVTLDIYCDYYEVSDRGNVRRCQRDGQYRWLTPRVHRQGYLEAKMSVNRREKSVLIHRLVMFAFIGTPPDGMEVNHINGVKSDNRLENLEYVTPKENTRHAIEVMGRIGPRGEKHANARLTANDVRQIRCFVGLGRTIKDVAQQFGVTPTHVDFIVKRKVWKHIE